MPERFPVQIPEAVRKSILVSRGENINDFTDRIAESLVSEGWRVNINHPVPEEIDGRKATVRIYAENEDDLFADPPVAICIDKHEPTDWSVDRLLQFPDEVCRIVVLMFAWETEDNWQIDAIVPVMFPETASYLRSKSRKQSVAYHPSDTPEGKMEAKERFGRRGSFNRRRQV